MEGWLRARSAVKARASGPVSQTARKVKVKVNAAHAAETHVFTASTRASDDPRTAARVAQARRASHSLATLITRSQYNSSHCSQLPRSFLLVEDVSRSTLEAEVARHVLTSWDRMPCNVGSADTIPVTSPSTAEHHKPTGASEVHMLCTRPGERSRCHL
ncbi:hypothetical protein PSPO01_04657 [Paraphaeosphaeria sporulosa]